MLPGTSNKIAGKRKIRAGLFNNLANKLLNAPTTVPAKNELAVAPRSTKKICDE